MPTYTYACKCGKSKDVFHGILEKPSVACDCGETMGRAVTQIAGAFVKSITSSKYWKEDRLRKKKNAELEVKQLERYSSAHKLVPNYNGEEVGTWNDAKKKAVEEGRPTAHFDKMIAIEKNSSNSSSVDEKRWKSAKEKLKQIH